MTEKFDTLEIGGVVYKTQLTEKWINRKQWEQPNPNLLYSHIPGTILRIDVKEGQVVAEGETLLIIQAMKMNNKLNAPFAGKIKSISVAIGNKIPKGTLMVEMEKSEAV